MPVIVHAHDHHPVLTDESALRRGHRIEHVELIEVVVERRLVRDHEIRAARGGATQHVERRHHRDRDAGHPRRGVAILEGVDRWLGPRNADVCLMRTRRRAP
jgi:hypothetical protein